MDRTTPEYFNKLEDRISDLEDFESRVKLGQKWVVCLFATVGGLIAAVYYTLSSWEIWLKHH